MNKTVSVWIIAIVSVLIVIGFFRVSRDHSNKAPAGLSIVRNYRAVLHSDVILENGLIKNT